MEQPKEKATKQQIEAYYAHFLSHIQNNLAKAKAMLGKQTLDYSIAEIDQIGKNYRDYVKKKKVKGDWHDEQFEMFVTYCGEAWMRYLGGNWKICLQKADRDYGFPIIVQWGPPEYPWTSVCPKDWARNIESGDKDPLSLPWRNKLNYFKVSDEWGGKCRKD
ncbi:hypothetical protein [Flavobacterium sp.]|uniref:hypothetical protein n=1 Tax=Flavobacterium sp. TaxID=239 RepID=UPI0039E5FC0F